MGAGAKIWGWEPTTKVWVPLRVDADGSIHVVGYVDKLDDIGDVNVPAPGDHDIIDRDAATGKWVKRALGDMGAHQARHQFGGADEVNIRNLLGIRLSPLYYKAWSDIAGFTVAADGAGTFTPIWDYGILATAAVINKYATIYSTFGTWVAHASYGHFLSTKLSFRQTTNQLVYFGLFDNPTAPTDIEKHFGFKVDNADIYATCGDGAAQTIEDTGVDANVDTWLAIDSNATSLDFYVNGALVKSFTTNRPTGVSLNLVLYAKTLAAANKEFYYYPLTAFLAYQY